MGCKVSPDALFNEFPLSGVRIVLTSCLPLYSMFHTTLGPSPPRPRRLHQHGVPAARSLCPLEATAAAPGLGCEPGGRRAPVHIRGLGGLSHLRVKAQASYSFHPFFWGACFPLSFPCFSSLTFLAFSSLSNHVTRPLASSSTKIRSCAFQTCPNWTDTKR